MSIFNTHAVLLASCQAHSGDNEELFLFSAVDSVNIYWMNELSCYRLLVGIIMVWMTSLPHCFDCIPKSRV